MHARTHAHTPALQVSHSFVGVVQFLDVVDLLLFELRVGLRLVLHHAHQVGQMGVSAWRPF